MSAKRKKTREPGWYNHPAIRITWKVLSVIFRCILTICLVGLITGCFVGCAMAIYIFTSVDVSSEVPELTTSTTAETSIMLIYDDKDKQWEEFMRLEGANHIWVDMEQIPDYMQKAVIAIEDERFYSHDGVDWKRTFSAFANLLLKFSDVEYGGSTLTQQLIKQITGNNDHSVVRKITEIMEALELEKQYSKDEILESYLNILPLTGNYIGVGVGANYYFGVDVEDLSLAQCAVLASITQNPSFYNPYTHPENVRDRQQTVLSKMLELGFISQEEYDQAMGEEIIYCSSISVMSVQDYYTDMVIERVIADLQKEYGYGYTQAENMVYYGGLKIYSYEQPKLQRKMEKLYADESIYPDHITGDDEDPRVAFFATDYNGKVICTVGDRGEKSGDRVTNISTMSARQPGSSIKPIAVYDLGIEDNLFTYSSVIADAPCVTSGGKPWPPNYGYTTAFNNGYTNLYMGLQKSLNTVSVQVLNQVGLERSFEYLTKVLGVTTFDEEMDMNFSALGLGGCYNGMYLSELTSAYQIFGNSGIYNGFYPYEKVLSRDGKMLLESKPLGVQAIQPDTASVMNDLLQQVIRGPAGTLTKVSGSWPRSMEVFAKTGTTDANNDVLAVGGTPHYVAGCWFGYRYNNAMTYTQAQAVKELWNKGMHALHEGLPNESFEDWGDIRTLRFCTKSGKIASASCTSTNVGTYRSCNIPGTCTQCGGTAATTTQPSTAQTNATQAPIGDPTKAPETPTEPVATEPVVTDPPADVTPTDPPVTPPTDPQTPPES